MIKSSPNHRIYHQNLHHSRQNNTQQSQDYTQYSNSLNKQVLNKQQIKSMSTLQNKKYIEGTPKKPGYFLSFKKHTNIYSPNLKQTNLYKKGLLNNKNRIHEQLQKKQSLESDKRESLKLRSKLKQQTLNKKMEQQNSRLKSQLLDCQLRERANIQKINKLQKLCVKLENILSNKQAKTKEQQDFLKVLKFTFKDCFGITGYKQIWAKEKQILRDWMQFTTKQKLYNKKSRQKINYTQYSKLDRSQSQQSQKKYIKIGIKQSHQNPIIKIKKQKNKQFQTNPQLQLYQSV